MTFRSLAASLGVAAVLGLAGFASAQEKDESARAQRKGGANSDAEKAGAPGGTTEKATFGGGCFWCIEAVFERIPGVKSVVSGYAGGTVPYPTYEMVSGGVTGHAEVVQVEYDPATVTYEKLLKVFWASHDPTSLNRQGPDMGPQYRSIILYHNDDQKRAAQESYRELTAARVFRNRIVTELVPLADFYPAEAYHQDYYRKHSDAPYCRMMIAPKLRKLKLK